MGRQMVNPAKGEHIVEFIGNIEDFPLGKKEGYYNGSGSHDVTHLSVYIWNTAEPKERYNRLTPLDEIDEPLLHVVSVEMEGPLLDGYPSETAKNLFPPKPADLDESEHIRQTLAAFIGRAFRRAARPEEVDNALTAFGRFKKLTGDDQDAMRKTMATLLVSPKFLYLVEPSPEAKPTQARRLNAYELATRLSYFLWASMPTMSCSTSLPTANCSGPRSSSNKSRACARMPSSAGWPGTSVTNGSACRRWRTSPSTPSCTLISPTPPGKRSRRKLSPLPSTFSPTTSAR